MKIGILGSRGIPNRYGGFEQFAEYLSLGLLERGMQVWVYNSHTHPYSDSQWKGISLIHCNDPEDRIGATGQFIYDLNCINDSRKRGFDILLQLGYTSSSVWHWRLPAKTKIITNMDGLEWKRSKYSLPVRKFLKHAEKLAVNSSHALVADSEAIQGYLKETYHVASTFIPYGADVYKPVNPGRLSEFGLKPKNYFLLIARMQADNHIEEIIKGVLASGSDYPLLVVGNINNKHGKYLQNKYNPDQVKFTGGIYDPELLNLLRYNCNLYFHGHSAGGTNPSLLEAMAASALICAHNNPFNRSVLGDDAHYFTSENEIINLINLASDSAFHTTMISNNLKKVRTKYNWKKVIEAYFELFGQILESQKSHNGH